MDDFVMGITAEDFYHLSSEENNTAIEERTVITKKSVYNNYYKKVSNNDQIFDGLEADEYYNGYLNDYEMKNYD